MDKNIPMDLGPQPLAALLDELGLANVDLVRASTAQLSFKVMHKACKGRRLTPRMQHKVLAALHSLRPEHAFTLKALFNY